MRDELITIIVCIMFPVLASLLFWTARKHGRTKLWALWAISPPIGIIALLMLWAKPEKIWGKIIRGVYRGACWVFLAGILFSIISYIRINSIGSIKIDEEARRGMIVGEAAEKAKHYREFEVGDYYCPYCKYVFGKREPQILTCPGCERRFKRYEE